MRNTFKSDLCPDALEIIKGAKAKIFKLDKLFKKNISDDDVEKAKDLLAKLEDDFMHLQETLDTFFLAEDTKRDLGLK